MFKNNCKSKRWEILLIYSLLTEITVKIILYLILILFFKEKTISGMKNIIAEMEQASR